MTRTRVVMQPLAKGSRASYSQIVDRYSEAVGTTSWRSACSTRCWHCSRVRSAGRGSPSRTWLDWRSTMWQHRRRTGMARPSTTRNDWRTSSDRTWERRDRNWRRNDRSWTTGQEAAWLATVTTRNCRTCWGLKDQHGQDFRHGRAGGETEVSDSDRADLGDRMNINERRRGGKMKHWPLTVFVRKRAG